MTDTQLVAEEFCRHHRLGPRHEPHYWQWSGHHYYCPGTDPDAPAAPKLTVDLLIAKYEGRRLGLLDALATGRLTATAQADTLAREDEVNRILTDLRDLRATQEA